MTSPSRGSAGTSSGGISAPLFSAAVAATEILLEFAQPADGALSIEYEENPKDPIADLQECVAVARKALGQA